MALCKPVARENELAPDPAAGLGDCSNIAGLVARLRSGLQHQFPNPKAVAANHPLDQEAPLNGSEPNFQPQTGDFHAGTSPDREKKNPSPSPRGMRSIYSNK
ncbi:hypothetical protein EYZ11_013022 [Aspergillus tanneri]|uniref:Uncharacterized protein n=1 Tax=Aspergillus tanneri TaxID=1220188 RepID=A0A4S3J448_9EURO|nr:uncharacterized protein ATNIH1004_005753 [Aspergillus tanneri]KAA8647070.1 hypothetical protein ATNIH1004_005753 [Aspergillus tanneri]THC87531.1 hypothetical protein EYZ11_013022 [Aspergillus tanneri]